MPSKNPKRRKKISKKQIKKQIEAQERLWDFNLFFSDTTMAETDGVYEDVNDLMNEDPALGEHNWVVKSHITIRSAFGEGLLLLNFYHNRKVYIIDYLGASAGLYNPDIRCLCQWCQSAGWEIPEPSEALIRSNLVFWKLMWDTLLIDSAYLDKRYGIRESLMTHPITNDEEDELTEEEESND